VVCHRRHRHSGFDPDLFPVCDRSGRCVRRKALSPDDLAGDVDKLRAFFDHVGAAFRTLTAGEQYCCEPASQRVVDILRYAGHVEEAARIESALSQIAPIAAQDEGSAAHCLAPSAT
jgi:hypothetical protein